MTTAASPGMLSYSSNQAVGVVKIMMFNLRISEELADAIGEAAEEIGMSKSAWAREVLAGAAYGGISVAEIADRVKDLGIDHSAVQPGSRTLNIRTARPYCDHPEDKIKVLPFSEVCSGCGEIIGRR